MTQNRLDAVYGATLPAETGGLEAAMIRMTTWMGKDTRMDYASCDWEGRVLEVRGRSAMAALARVLVEAGCPDQPWEAHTPEGERSLFGASLHGWAKRMVSEDDRKGLRFVAYQPFPDQRIER